LNEAIAFSLSWNFKMAAFWGAALCILVDTDPDFNGAYCLYHQGDKHPY
jgi:hypothetical protein